MSKFVIGKRFLGFAQYLVNAFVTVFGDIPVMLDALIVALPLKSLFYLTEQF